MTENERVIVIDNICELDQVSNEKFDLTCWQADEDSKTSNSGLLIKNALRNTPDWLILAEARGKEMVDVLNAAMTGIPVITTIHSRDAASLSHRMGRMMMKSEQKIDYKEALIDIYYHFHFYFYLSKEIVNKKVKRYISEIIYRNNKGEAYSIFKRKNKSITYYKLPEELLSELEVKKESDFWSRKEAANE